MLVGGGDNAAAAAALSAHDLGALEVEHVSQEVIQARLWIAVF